MRGYLLSLPPLVPGLLSDAGTTGTAILPTGEIVNARVAIVGDPDENGIALPGTAGDAVPSYFKMSIAGVTPSDCRRLAYYGIGGGYGLKIDSTLIPRNTALVVNIENGCGTGTTPVTVTLTSR